MTDDPAVLGLDVAAACLRLGIAVGRRDMDQAQVAVFQLEGCMDRLDLCGSAGVEILCLAAAAHTRADVVITGLRERHTLEQLWPAIQAMIADLAALQGACSATTPQLQGTTA